MKHLILLVIFLFSFTIHSQSLLDENPPLVGSIRYLENDIPIYKEISRKISKFIKEKDNFIPNKNDSRNKDELFTYPFKDFYQIENYYGTDYKLVPNLVSLYNTNENIYIAKIMWAFHLENGGTYLHMINNFLIYYDKNKFELRNITSYNIKDWNRRQIENIKYIYKKNRVFNGVDTKKMLDFDKYLAAFFEVPFFNFTYILCENTNDFHKTLGFDFNLDMYGADTVSGIAFLSDDLIFSGNNSEYYPHELVHLYVFKRFGNTDDFLNEGLATYLGGSQGMSYEECLLMLKKYYDENRDNNFLNNAISGKILESNLSISYISAAYICEMIYNDFGKKQLFDMISNVDNTNSLKAYLLKLYHINDELILNDLFIDKLSGTIK